jgi:phage tail sheath gpL-like
MNTLQKIVLLMLFFRTNPKNKELNTPIDNFLDSHADIGQAVQELGNEGLVDNVGVTKKGQAIAHKLQAIGTNYADVAVKGSFGNCQAMLTGAWEGFKGHCSQKQLYVDSSAFTSLERMVKEGTELLKNATLADANKEVV